MNIDSRIAAVAAVAMVVTFVLAELTGAWRGLRHVVGLGLPLLQLATAYLFWRKWRTGWLFAIVAVPSALAIAIYLLQFLPDALLGGLMHVFMSSTVLSVIQRAGYVALSVYVGVFVVALMIPPLPVRERGTVSQR